MRCNGTSLTSKLAILNLCGFLISSPGLAEEPVYGAPLQAGHGYRIRMEQSTIQDPPITREGPSTASDTFEIVSGVINYIGDWEMRITAGDYYKADDIKSTVTRRWSVDIRQNTKTLGRLFEEFPGYANRYEIYLSMMGKNAISLREFLSIVQEHSE